MKKLLFLFLLVTSPVYAVDWYVYVSSDADNPSAAYQVNISSNTTQIVLPGSKVEICELTGVQKSAPIKEFPELLFETRNIGCSLLDESIVFIGASCRTDKDDFQFRDLYLFNSGHLYDLNLQCLNSIKHEEK